MTARIVGAHLDQIESWNRSIITSANNLALESQSPADLYHLKVIIENFRWVKDELEMVRAAITPPPPPDEYQTHTRTGCCESSFLM